MGRDSRQPKNGIDASLGTIHVCLAQRAHPRRGRVETLLAAYGRRKSGWGTTDVATGLIISLLV